MATAPIKGTPAKMTTIARQKGWDAGSGRPTVPVKDTKVSKTSSTPPRPTVSAGNTTGKPLPSGWAPAQPAAGAKPMPTTPARTPVNPYLTPDQQAALTNYDYNYSNTINDLNRAFGVDTFNTQQSLASAQKTHDVNTETSNENAAARGLFQSSIRASALNDIDATLTTRSNILNTALSNASISTQAKIAQLGSEYAVEHNLYNTYAVQNAAGQTPAAGATAAGATTSGGAGGGTGAVGAGNTHPTSTGPKGPAAGAVNALTGASTAALNASMALRPTVPLAGSSKSKTGTGWGSGPSPGLGQDRLVKPVKVVTGKGNPRLPASNIAAPKGMGV